MARRTDNDGGESGITKRQRRQWLVSSAGATFELGAHMILRQQQTRDNQRPLVEDAVDYCRLGWSVFPVRQNKQPAIPHWRHFQTEPADETLVRKMFESEAAKGVAVVLGEVSGGLACRDFDCPDGFLNWCNSHPDEASGLPVVRTGRGFHVIGRLEQPTFKVFQSGDERGELRGDHLHYIVLPPSLHPSGIRYEWLTPLPPKGAPLPLLPLSLQVAQSQDNSSQYMTCAQGAIGTLIENTQPTGPGQRNRMLFQLARGLVAELGRDADHMQLRNIVKTWHSLAVRTISTKPFDHSWDDFIRAWAGVKVPMGHSLKAAVATAKSNPLPRDAQLYEKAELRSLVALCAQLQTQWGDHPFPLGCRKAAEILGISPAEANRHLKLLEFDGLLQLAAKGSKSSKKASEWRYTGKGQK